MTDIAIGITLAPRDEPTINESIKSLRAAGVSMTLNIFAEPGEYHIDDNNINLIINEKRLGCFGNFNHAVRSLLDMGTKYIFITQDDYIYDLSLGDEMLDITKGGNVFGYYNFTSRPKLSETVYKNGRNELDYKGGRGVCYLIESDIMIKVINDPLYMNHLLTYTPNKQIDTIVPFIITRYGLPKYYHNPSLVAHVGESIIGHVDRDLGMFMSNPKEKILGGIASIPNRVNELRKTIDSVYYQVDELNVFLNGYEVIPEFLNRKRINVFMGDNSTGDAGKFYSVEEHEGYYITFDDDLVYHKNYVAGLCRRIEDYNRTAVIGVHGKILNKETIFDYHKDSNTYHYADELIEDMWVHILGTGTTAFHTDTIKVKYSDFKVPNMADVRLGKLAQEQEVPMCCIRHTGKEISTMDTSGSIYNSKQGKTQKEVEICNDLKRQIRFLPQVL